MEWIRDILEIAIAIAACSGFWAFIDNRKSKKDHETKLLLSLAEDRISFLGMSYIDRGYLTKEEHAVLYNIYDLYLKSGGEDGPGKKIMDEVNSLPLYKPVYVSKKGDENNAE